MEPLEELSDEERAIRRRQSEYWREVRKEEEEREYPVDTIIRLKKECIALYQKIQDLTEENLALRKEARGV